MILSTLRMVPRPNKRLETLEILRSVQGPTQAQAGCIGTRIYEEEGADQAILYCERWESDEALHQHVRSDLYRRILAAFELASQQPEVCFYLVSTTRGIELIQQLRGLEFDTSHLEKTSRQHDK